MPIFCPHIKQIWAETAVNASKIKSAFGQVVDIKKNEQPMENWLLVFVMSRSSGLIGSSALIQNISSAKPANKEEVSECVASAGG